MAVPTFVTSVVSIYDDAPSSTYVVPRPTTGGALLAGDVILFAFAFDSDNATLIQITPPVDMLTIIPVTNVGTSTTTIQGALYAKVITAAEAASPPESWNFTLSQAVDGTFSTTRIRGVDPASLTAVTAASGYAITSYPSAVSSKVSPAVTTTVADTLLVAGVVHRSGSQALSGSGPSGYTRVVDAMGIGGRGHALAIKAQPAAGTSTTATWTTNGGNLGFAWQTALRPAPEGPVVIAPTVSAGADATVTLGAAFTRTATEDDGNAPITSRTWTIVSGPAGVGDIIGTAAALSWTPTAAGSFVLRYTATNSAGTGSDDVTVTVQAPPAPVLLQQANGRGEGDTFRVAVECSADTATVRLQAATDAGFTTGAVTGAPVAPTVRSSVGYAHPEVSGLAPGATYFYRIGLEDTDGTVHWLGATGSFRTDSGEPGPQRLVFGSCLNGNASAALAAMAGRNPDLVAITGDRWYRDNTSTNEDNFRLSWREQVRHPDYAELAVVGHHLYVPDDHDAHTDDGTWSANSAGWASWNAVYREFEATGSLPQPTRGVYDTFVYNGVRYILLDTRSYAVTGSVVLGAEQEQWLYDTVEAATEDAIVIVQGAVWHGPGVSGEDGWLGALTERNRVAATLAATGKNIVMTAGDMHALAVEDGTNSPGGIPVFHAAPIHNSASQKGGPYTAGPYPSGTSTVEQYGELDITFTDTDVVFAFTGYSAPTTARITETVTMPRAVPTPPAPHRVMTGGQWVDEIPRVRSGGQWVPDLHRKATGTA